MTTSMNEYIPRFLNVKRKVQETGDTYTIVLDETSKAEPGQFFMLSVPGAGEAPISVASGTGRELEFTIRSVGKVTSAIRERDRIGVRGPYGNAWPYDKYENILAIAGGIGIPPVRSLIERMIDKGRGEQLEVLYGARTPEDIVYYSLIDSWSSNMRMRLTVDRGNTTWKGNVGFVTSLIGKSESPRNSAVFIIGPPLMMKNAVAEALKSGFREDRIFLSLERRMECGIGVCGHCNIGHYYVCESGPIFPYSSVKQEPELFL